MNERLKKVRESLKDSRGKKYSQTKFAEEMHITRDMIATYESGRVVPTSLFINTLCDKYNVNELWLRTGEGEMFVPVDKETEIAKIASELYKDDDSFMLKLVKFLSEMSEEQKKVLKHFIDTMAKKEPLD